MAAKMKPVEAWAVVTDGMLTASPVHGRPMIFWTEDICKAATRRTKRVARVRIVEIAAPKKRSRK